MNILHLWDVVGVSCVLAKYQRKMGHNAQVMMRSGFDAYGILKFYGVKPHRSSAFTFYRLCLRKARRFDIVHIHTLTKVVPFIRKPKVLHFHGSQLRNAGIWRTIENYFARKFVDKVLVSTPDLLSRLPSAEWLPNPVDTEHFYPKESDAVFERNLTFSANRKPRYQLEDGSTVPYQNLPDYLLSQKVFVQPGTPVSRSLKKLSLEALACGVDVIWNGLRIKGELPEIHKAENVAKKTIEIYEEILS